MLQIPENLSTQRLELKRPQPTRAFAETIFQATEHCRDHFLPWLNWASPEITKTVEDEFTFLTNEYAAQESGKRYSYAIFEKENTHFIGLISLSRHGEISDRRFEIAYWLLPTACNKGYMTESLKALCQALFEAGVERLTIRADIENLPSNGVAQRCGFQHESIERHGHFDIINNRFKNMNVYARLKDDPAPQD